MFSRSTLPVWIVLILMSGMFLMGQDSWPPQDGTCTDPLNPSAECGADHHCIPQPGSGSQGLCISPTGQGTQFEYCVQDVDCGDIYRCSSIGATSNICLQWCRVGFDSDCIGYPDENCISLAPSVYIGSQEWGICDTVGTAPDEWSCSAGIYAASDGCDCGCAVFDPDCANSTKSVCDYCDLTGGCAEGNAECSLWGCTDAWCPIDPTDNSICL